MSTVTSINMRVDDDSNIFIVETSDPERKTIVFTELMSSITLHLDRKALFVLADIVDQLIGGEDVTLKDLGVCAGCSHPLNEHDADGCTGWTAGVMCMCEVTP